MEQVETIFKQVEHPNIRFLTKEEIVSFQIRYTLEEFSVNNTDVKVLSYVYLYGEDAISKLIADGISKSEQSIRNIYSRFRKKGIIHGKNSTIKLHPEIQPFVEDLEFKIKLKVKKEI